ncbi:MAG: response regulator [Clostridia bacterium]|nr:response regulator [Clostridia bacterium]
MIKVLAIDDEEPIRKWLQFCISRFDGFACITAASGKEGIALWQAQQPDIILSDIEMPGMSGLEMLKEIQS